MARTLVDQPPVARPPATRPPAARPPVATAPPPAEDSYEEIAPDVLAGMNAEATQARRAPHNVGPSAPVAFLIHGGTAPVPSPGAPWRPSCASPAPRPRSPAPTAPL